MLTVAFVLNYVFWNSLILLCNTNCAAGYFIMLLSYRLVMLFCTEALTLYPTLFKLTKPTGELRRAWFQIIMTFLLFYWRWPSISRWSMDCTTDQLADRVILPPACVTSSIFDPLRKHLRGMVKKICRYCERRVTMAAPGSTPLCVTTHTATYVW